MPKNKKRYLQNKPKEITLQQALDVVAQHMADRDTSMIIADLHYQNSGYWAERKVRFANSLYNVEWYSTKTWREMREGK